MAHYIEFPTGEGDTTILIEIDDVEAVTPAGVEKAGLLSRKKNAGEVVERAALRFDEAVKKVIGENVRALNEAVGKLAKAPDEFELTFGLKATGEAGNIAVGKVGGDVNFEVRMLWRREGGGGKS